MLLVGVLWLFAAAYAAIVGIDLGHQNTKAIMAAPGIPFEIVFTDEGKRKDLSAISLKPKLKDGVLDDAERVYGAQIGSLCTRFPESCAANLKALLGRTIDDPAVRDYYAAHFGVTLYGDEARNNSVLMTLGSAEKANFTVEELTAMSLNHLKERVLKVLAAQPRAKNVAEDVAVSIGPYASQSIRLAYLQALNVANFSSVLGLVDEGSAVALSYVTNKKLADEDYDGQTVYDVIYDVGAGSTTATLFSYTPFKNGLIVVDVEAVGYDESLGGELLTRSMYDILFAKFALQHGLDDDVQLPPKYAARLFDAAEKAKTILSANTEYKVSLESFYDDRDFKAVVTRSEFEAYNFDLLERVTRPILDALAQCPGGAKSVADIQSVILNGGATRTPFIQKQLVTLLGSEDKIAKVVNTDEACALGTAYRAYHLKMLNSKVEVELRDRIFSNFEMSTSDSGLPQVVFAKGTYSGNETEVLLGPRTKDSVEIGLYENGELYASHFITGLDLKTQYLKCNDTEMYAVFSVDKSKMFLLDGLSVKCVSKEAEEKSSTAVNATRKARAKVPLRIPVPPARYTKLRPFTYSERQAITTRLETLKDRDVEKIVFEEHKNQLESQCYALRAFIEENMDTLLSELDEDALDTVRSFASEVVEWLEWDSDASLLEEVKEKLGGVLLHRKELENVVKMLGTDLSLAALEGVYEEGKEVAGSIQDYLLEYGKQISMLRDKYTEDELDFDKENARIMKHIYGTDQSEGSKLNTHFSTFKQALKDLSEIIALPKKKFVKVLQRELFDKSEAVTTLLMDMMEDVVTLQSNHEKRVNYLLDQHKKLVTRKTQKEQKRKLKEEKLKAQDEIETEADAEVETETETEPVSESASETRSESSYSSGSSEAHDEL